LPLYYNGFDATIITIIAVAVAGGYIYQGPPFRLGYYGLGEPICFVTWVLSVAAAYYSQIQADETAHRILTLEHPKLPNKLQYLLRDLLWSRKHFLCAPAVLVAFPTAVILFCSHFHQLEDDKRAGKRSPIVRLGTLNAMIVLQCALLLLFALEGIFFAVGMLPIQPFILSLLSIPYALELASFVRRTHAVPAVVRVAKYYAVKFHFVHGVLLSLGFLLTVRNPVTS